MLGVDGTACVAGKLTKGKTYYLTIVGFGTCQGKATVKEHKHHYQEDIDFAVCDAGFDEAYDGSRYKFCPDCGKCIILETYYAPKKIELSKNSCVYNGKAKKPTVTVKDRKGNVIPKDNYKVTYSDNVMPGKATVNVKFCSAKYTGSMQTTFTINMPKTKITAISGYKNGFKVNLQNQSKIATGYQIQYSKTKNFAKAKKVNAKGGINSVRYMNGLKSKQKYYVRIRSYRKLNGKTYYSAWSGYKTVKTL